MVINWIGCQQLAWRAHDLLRMFIVLTFSPQKVGIQNDGNILTIPRLDHPPPVSATETKSPQHQSLKLSHKNQQLLENGGFILPQ